MNRFDDSYITTFTGKKFWPLNPCADHICLEDIAWALSMKCRFNGHTRFFYSVAEHSCRVFDEAVREAEGFYRPDITDFPNAPRAKTLGTGLRLYEGFALLFHDAAEAYIPDFSRPIKWAAAFRHEDHGYAPARMIEHDIEREVWTHFGFAHWNVHEQCQPLVNKYDNLLCVTEARDLTTNGVREWGPEWPAPMPTKIKPWSQEQAFAEFVSRALLLIPAERTKHGEQV